MDSDTDARRSNKRARSPSQGLSDTSSDVECSGIKSLAGSPLLKHHKLDLESFASSSTAPHTFTCNRSPVCNSKPLTFESLEAIQAHHLRCHLWGCEATTYFSIELPGEGREISHWKGRPCGKVFPNERVLTLHLGECHDIDKKQRQNEGKKIFECLLPRNECDKVCASPKSRRLHMITKHHYPKQYYYGIVLHGLNRLLHNEGPGASMIRPIPPDVERSKVLGSGARSPLPRPQTRQEEADDGVAALTGMMKESSLAFVPRKVTTKARSAMTIDG